MPGAARSRSWPRGARRRAVPALIAVLVAGVLLFGQLSALAHHALVTHVRCAHGELVHLERGDGSSPRAPDDAGFNRGATGAAAHDHEHCAAGAFLSGSLLAASASPVGVAAAAFVVSSPVVPVRVVASLDVYAFAPKTSPPALTA